MVSGESSDNSDSSAPSAAKRVIKRYSNRKLYDTKDSRYVTLLQIADMVRAGEDVQIIDNATKEDKTDVTLALIISEELKARPRGIPLATLKALIRQRGEKILSQLREGPIGKLMPKDPSEGDGRPSSVPPPQEDDVSQSKDAQHKGMIRQTIEQWQQTIDERIRAVLPNFTAFRELQAEVKRVAERLDALESKLGGGSPPGEQKTE
ncbi:MAG TPA: polyhydroxyalkanoate synthesis regulator DNA-binding domain-containing protein [Polyangiaceae bacterium]|nr:polyhydroxyalkanoate synthesis regulator DNA-binding domain-containing protein [Polyangiaceae bacterium]